MPRCEILSTNCVRKCTCEYLGVGALGQLILLFANQINLEFGNLINNYGQSTA